MDPPREQHVQVLRVGHRAEALDLCLPEREAAAGADVTAALAPFEDEPPGAVLHEPVEQAGRRHVQVGGDARGLERGRLGRAPARDERDRRRHPAHHLELLFAQLGGHEAEDPDPPCPLAEQVGRLLEQGFDLGPRHQRECQEGQPAPIRAPRRRRRPGR